MYTQHNTSVHSENSTTLYTCMRKQSNHVLYIVYVQCILHVAVDACMVPVAFTSKVYHVHNVMHLVVKHLIMSWLDGQIIQVCIIIMNTWLLHTTEYLFMIVATYTCMYIDIIHNIQLTCWVRAL